MPTAFKLSFLYFAQLQTRAMPSELNGSAYQYKRESPSKRSGSSSAPGESKDILQHSRKNKDNTSKTHWRFPVHPDKGYEQDDFCSQRKNPNTELQLSVSAHLIFSESLCVTCTNSPREVMLTFSLSEMAIESNFKDWYMQRRKFTTLWLSKLDPAAKGKCDD